MSSRGNPPDTGRSPRPRPRDLRDCRVTSFLATSANLAAFSPRRVEKEEKESRLAASVTCQVPQAYRMLS